MVPQYDINSPGSLMNLPVLGSTTGQNQILANVASISRSQTSPVMDRFNIRPAITAGVDGRDLGAVASDVQNAIDALKKDLPRGSVITLRGQVSTMQDSFFGLYVGLVFSMLLVYLLMVVNFQSWSEPLIIITALPVALAGIMWMLFITETTLSVPALMGAIMCMGVATANSVLVITFANERFEETQRFLPRSFGSRLHPHSPGPDDRGGDDHRDVSHGARPGRRRRAECAARARRHRRLDLCHRCHALLCSHGF